MSTARPLGVAVIGTGLMGTRRAQIAAKSAGSRLVIVADAVPERATGLADQLGCEATTDWHAAVSHPEVEIVVVSAFHNMLATINREALESGKHVLCEKPGALTSKEARQLRDTAERQGRHLRIGFNYRFLPGMRRAAEIARDGGIGEVILIRGELGHGARPNYEEEWKASASLAGGGAALDPGVHVIDLSRWFMGEITRAQGVSRTYCWNIAPLDDNAFMLLETADGRTASLHTSLTQWKNRFRFDIIGQSGFVTVEGRGGHYGRQRLTWCKDRPQGQAPPIEEIGFDAVEDDFLHSLAEEWDDFLSAIHTGSGIGGGITDAVQALAVVEAVYRASERGCAQAVEIE
jgi:predicted dehydrogenase